MGAEHSSDACLCEPGDKTMATAKLLAESTEETTIRPDDALMAQPSDFPRWTSLGGPWPAVAPSKDQALPQLEVRDSPLLTIKEGSGGLLEDETIDGLDLPPEPGADWEERYKASKRVDQPSPIPSIFPGRYSYNSPLPYPSSCQLAKHACNF